MENEPKIFSKETLDRISQPDQLNDYLRVPKPMIWLLLGAVMIVLAGLAVWSLMGTVDITANGNAYISEGQAIVVLSDNEKYHLDEGMKVSIDDKDTSITRVENDIFGNPVGYASVSGTDGAYPVSVVVDSVHPFELLFGVK